MSSVIKKCPKDGIVYDAAFTGNCASCFGPLKFFCKTHSEWLDDANCQKCAGTPAAGTVAATPAPSAGPSIVGILAVLAICAGVFVACGWFVYRVIYTKSKPASAPVAQALPAPTPVPAPAPTPAPPSVPVRTPLPPPPVSAPAIATISLNQLFADPDPHVGKLVTTGGTVQFRDAGKETFDLRDGDHILTVQYRGVPAAMKTTIAGTSAARRIVVTGTLQRDETDNSYFVIARTVEVP